MVWNTNFSATYSKLWTAHGKLITFLRFAYTFRRFLTPAQKHCPFVEVSYAFVVHGKGPAVEGFGTTLDPDNTLTSSEIVLKNNTISNIKCWTKEIPGKSIIIIIIV